MARRQEPSLEATGTLVSTTSSPRSKLNPPWVVGWSRRQYSCHVWTPVRLKFNSAKSCSSVVLNYSSFGVRIEIDPYPGMIGIPKSVLNETGKYLDTQFVSPFWMRSKITLGNVDFQEFLNSHEMKLTLFGNRSTFF